MKITKIEITRENLVLTRPYTISYKTVDSVENIIIKLYLENGMIGLGACNPSKYVVGVNNDDTILNLTEQNLAFLKGADIRSFQDLLDKTYTNFSADAGAKVLIDVALHDAFTQYLGIPLVTFFGQKIKELPTSVTIGIKDIEATLEEAKEYLDSGFNNIKVKLGQELKLDIERLRAIRKTFGKKPIIRIDANQGWSKAETMDFFESVGDLDIELVEQPVKADQLMQLSSIPGVFKKLIAADESLVDANDALMLSKSPIPAGIFNIKLMKCGGIHEAKKIATIAEKANIDLMWGCNDESIITISAALHAAFSCANTKYIDLDGSLDLAKDVVKGGFKIENGIMSLSNKPGLGVELI